MNTDNNIDNFDFNTYQENAIRSLKEGKPLSGKDGVITPLIKMLLEKALEGELEAHLQYPKNAKTKSGNTRNGKSKKTLKTSYGSFDLETPRDRESTFEPQIIQKRQVTLNEEIDNKIISLYGLGNSYDDIRNHLQELYGVNISSATMTKVTDKILPLIKEWQTRTLDNVYPIIYMDAIYFKVRENGKVIKKAVYIVLGINMDGKKDVLGFYIGENESSKFWLSVLTELSNRGVKDILIICIDNLKGFKEAINSIYPDTEVQLCVIHQIRNSLKYISYKDYKAFLNDLKNVYKSSTKEQAEVELLSLEKNWCNKYPIVIKSWLHNWDELSNYFKYSEEIRRLIYTTNIIEGLNRQIRKYTKTKGSFINDASLIKQIYLAIQNISKKWIQPFPHWKLTLSQLAIIFEGRLELDLKY